jgi:CRP/FNR family transcriptional regulator, cyclic AMP receptor protein
VKRLLHRIRSQSPLAASDGPSAGAAPSGFFTSMFDEREDTPAVRASWADRAGAIDAQPMDRTQGRKLLEKVFGADPPPVALTREENEALLQGFHFAVVAPGRELISQDERGDFLVVVLDGLVAVDRVQLWGDRVSLGEARMGDVLGEMSLLDAGPRFSTCTTVQNSQLAVLDAAALDRLMRDQPRIALALITMLARRMSLRLRYVSTRLTALLVRR